MGLQIDLDPSSPPAPLRFIRRAPSPVRQLTAVDLRGGRLRLEWKPPARVVPVDGYRIERTREGRVYEPLGETENTVFIVPAPPLREPWFYRVTAFNALGASRDKLVYYFERRRHPCRPPREGKYWSRLIPIAVVPGLRVVIWEFESEQVAPRRRTVRLGGVSGSRDATPDATAPHVAAVNAQKISLSPDRPVCVQ